MNDHNNSFKFKNRSKCLSKAQRNYREEAIGRIRSRGGYRELRTFRTATIIYDGTYWFCEKFVDSFSRTVDQMVQAARSGRQNIAEGSRAAAASSKTELRLVNVARANLEGLLLDYEYFLGHLRQPQWNKDDPRAQAVWTVARTHQSDWSDLTGQQRFALYAEWLENRDPFVRANAIICLIHPANYLLDQQIEALEKQFVLKGSYSEQLATNRPHHQSDLLAGPKCGKPMVLRTAKTGENPGKQFLGCSGYPDCRGVKKSVKNVLTRPTSQGTILNAGT